VINWFIRMTKQTAHGKSCTSPLMEKIIYVGVVNLNLLMKPVVNSNK